MTKHVTEPDDENRVSPAARSQPDPGIRMTHLDDLPEIAAGEHLSGPKRETVGTALAQVYNEGASLRAISGHTGRSYGSVHRLLSEAGVTFRGRGGVRKRKGTA